MDKILEIFYEHPRKEFTVREISKLIKIPKSTVHKYLAGLKKNKIIERNQASDSRIFKIKKINFFIEKLVASGLIDYLEKELIASCIILFGSFRKGESEKDSDIDIFVESISKKELNLEQFEKKLKHKIQLFIEQDINNLQPNLFNNVINGIKLSGSFKVKWWTGMNAKMNL